MTNHVVTISGTYEGDLRCNARHGPSGASITTDAPADNEGRGASFSPTDLVATALGTCVCTTMAIVARRRGIDLGAMRFEVQKEMVSTPARRIGRLTLRIHMPVTLTGEERAVLERAAHTCPVHRSLHADVEKPIQFTYGG
jgi:putative redox protein